MLIDRNKKVESGRITSTHNFRRITFDKEVLAGKLAVRGIRISVEMILKLLAKGAPQEDYPELEAEDLQATLLYAYHLVAGKAIFERESI